MKKLSLFIFMLLLMLVVCSSAHAQYFSQIGSGNGSGTTCANAQAISLINWSQEGPGSVISLCGSFVEPAGGSVVAVKVSGLPGNPLTIRFIRATLQSSHFSGQGAINLYGLHDILVEGNNQGVIENTAYGSGFPYAGDSRAINAQNCVNCRIENLTVRNIYVRNDYNDLNPVQQNLNCVLLQGATGSTVDHVTCTDAGWAFPGNANNLTISNCDMSHVDHGAAFGAIGQQGGFSFHDNHFHDSANWDSPTNFAHHDGVHLWGLGGNAITSAVIERNLFDGDPGQNVTGYVFLQQSFRNVIVRDNVFVVPANRIMSPLQFGATQTATTTAGGLSTNNVASGNYVIAGGHVHNGGAAIVANAQYNFTATGNVLLGGVWDIGINDGGTILKVDENIYEDLLLDAGSLNAFGYQGKSYHLLADWQAACGCDGNSSLLPAFKILSLLP